MYSKILSEHEVNIKFTYLNRQIYSSVYTIKIVKTNKVIKITVLVLVQIPIIYNNYHLLQLLFMSRQAWQSIHCYVPVSMYYIEDLLLCTSYQMTLYIHYIHSCLSIFFFQLLQFIVCFQLLLVELTQFLSVLQLLYKRSLHQLCNMYTSTLNTYTYDIL